jgi:hypothetical protein
VDLINWSTSCDNGNGVIQIACPRIFKCRVLIDGQCTLDGRIAGSDAVFESKFMLPWSFSEEAAAEKYMPQLRHNMWVVAGRSAVLSVITGGGKWVEIVTHADPLYQHLIVTAERKFWRCVESGEPPHLFGVEPSRPRIDQALMPSG